MKRTLNEELLKQIKLIKFLNEDLAPTGVRTKFVEALKGMVVAAKAVGGDAAISQMRNVYRGLPADIQTILNGKNIRNLDELSADLNKPYKVGGQTNPAKLVDDDLAERIVLSFEKQIFETDGNELLGDAIIDNFFTLKGISSDNVGFFKQLISFAKNGNDVDFYKLKQKLVPYFDDFYLKYAQRKLTKKIVDEVTDEPTWFEKHFKKMFDVVSGTLFALKGTFTRGYVTAAKESEYEQLMSRFMTLLDVIETKRNTPGMSANIDKEVVELNEIAAKISMVEKRNLEVLWSQWRDQLPPFVKSKMNASDISNDELFIKYVKYFEGATGKGEVYAKPKYIVSRLQAFLKMLTPPPKGSGIGFGRVVANFMERFLRGIFAGSFRTFKEVEDAYEILGKNKFKYGGFVAFERLMSYFVYLPIFYASVKTALSKWEDSYGYEMEPDPSDPNGVKVRLKRDKDGNAIPKVNIWFGNGQDYIGETEGAMAFLEVQWMNMRRQWGMAVGEDKKGWEKFLRAGGAVSPIGSDIIYNIVTAENVRSNKVDDENVKRLQEEAKRKQKQWEADSRAAAQKIKNEKIRQQVQDSLNVIKQKADSIMGIGEYERVKRIVSSDSLNY